MIKYFWLFIWSIFAVHELSAAAVGTVIESQSAVASYKINNKAKLSFSNKINFIKSAHEEDYQLEVFRYSATGSRFVNISHTTYSTDGAPAGKFASMKPLTLSSGEVVAIDTQIPLSESDTFLQSDPIIIVLKDKRANVSDTTQDKAEVFVDNGANDKETIRLMETTPKSGIFVGYIHPTVMIEQARKTDGMIYVYDNAVITIKPMIKSSRSTGGVHLSKSITIRFGEKMHQGREKPQSGKLAWVMLKSDKVSASIGEFVGFEAQVGNFGTNAIDGAKLHIKLPESLRYVKNSLKLDAGMKLDEDALSRNEIKVKLSELKNEVIRLRYVASVSADTEEAESVASCMDNNHQTISDLSTHKLKITKTHFANKGFIFGQIFSEEKEGLENIRIYCDDGTYALTDKAGKYHFEGLEKRVYAISIDSETLPTDHNISGEKTRFVDLSYAGIKRIDFTLLAQEKGKKPHHIQSGFVKKAQKSAKMPQYTTADLTSASVEKSTFLWPPEKYNPSVPSVKVALKYPKNHSVVLRLNGHETSPLNFDTTISEPNLSMQIATYRGLDIKTGDNALEALIKDEKGNLVETMTRNVHFASHAVFARVVEEDSQLIADGRNPIIIAVKLTDKQGYPIAEDTRINANIEPPYQLQTLQEGIKINPLSMGVLDNSYSIHGEGVTYISLAPTTKTGEAVLHFNFDNKDTMLRTWISPQNREWIVVGFAEGTFGHQEISKNMRHGAFENKEDISLFAKGSIKGDTLMTIAYNSAKPKTDSILAKIDPNEHYMIYQDNSTQDFDAQSQKKLYLKIEKKKFYALFGDFDTGLEINELSRYRRVLNGVKSEYNGERFSYNAFASESQNIFAKDEIAADGTSGNYHLKNKNILSQSERVTIEVRNRFKEDQIISQTVMSRFSDYSIDYEAGTLYFKSPLFSTDDGGNPRYIVVDYELQGTTGKSNILYGGRGAVKIGGNAELGSTYIHEDLGENKKSLLGVDATMQVNDRLKLKAEYATTSHEVNLEKVTGDAYLIEAFLQGRMHSMNAYYRVQNDAFGLDQLSQIYSQSQKIGIDGRLDYFKHVGILYSLYNTRDLDKKSEANTVELLGEIDHGFAKSRMGVRHNIEREVHSNQLLFGGEKMLMDDKIKVSVRYEHTIDNPTYAFPTRSQLEVRYGLFAHTDLFVRSEYNEYTKVKRLHNSIGFATRAWRGGEVESSISNGYENDAKNLFDTHGITQQYVVNEFINISGGIERRSTIKGVEVNDTEDFTAYAGAINFHKQPWTASIKAEHRDGTRSKKQNLDLGVYNQVSEEVGLSSGIRYHENDSKDDNKKALEANIAAVYRANKRWIVLNHLGIIQANGYDSRSNRIVNNLLLEYAFNDIFELGLQFGLKYVQEEVNDETFDNVVDLLGVHAVLQVSKYYDIGIHASTMHMLSAERTSHYGVEAGYTLKNHSRIGIGYNFQGYYDEDFSLKNYTTKGIYLKVRMKFDKENLKSLLEYAPI